MMELYTCGFNAWNQLVFEEDGTEEEPDDLFHFQRILSGNDIQLLHATLSATVIKTQSGLRHAGEHDALTQRSITDEDSLQAIAVAGNGKIAASDSTVQEYPNWPAFRNEPAHTWPFQDVKCLVAGQTHFAFLQDGNVYTWGDERYRACLGRDEASEESTPAAEPKLVTALVDLPTGPICKLVAGGYVTAALTAGHDLYIWGGQSNREAMIPGLSSNPEPLDLHGYDILDAAIGDNHMIIVTMEGTVWVIGEGVNGQLGLADVCQTTNEWKQAEVHLPARRRIRGAFAGPKSSFLLVEMAAEDGSQGR